MTSTRGALVSFAFVLSACSGSVTFRSTIDYSVNLDSYSANFTNAGLVSGMMISAPSCTPGAAGDMYCRGLAQSASAGTDLEVRCNSMGECDPEPYHLIEDLGVQNLDDLASPKVSVIDRLMVLGVDATRRTNTTNLDIPSFQLVWGSESASSGNLASSTKLLATVPAIPSGSTGALDIEVNAEGLAELDTYVRATSPKIRLFLVTNVDLEPNQQIPSGHLDLTVGLIIRASGHLR